MNQTPSKKELKEALKNLLHQVNMRTPGSNETLAQKHGINTSEAASLITGGATRQR